MEDINTGSVNTETGNDEKGYMLRFDIDGVYFKVLPTTDDNVSFELTDVTKELYDHGITEYSMELLVKTIREQDGREVLVSSFMDEDDIEKPNPLIELKVSKDKMEVVVKITASEATNKPTYNMVMDMLNEQGIIFGISEEKIQQAVKAAADYGTCEMLIVEGLKPKNGEDAQIIEHVKNDTNSRPEVLENGRVDFKNLNLFTVVTKGQLLMERIPQTVGTPGMNVFGDTVAAKPGKAAMLQAGKNTKIVNEHQIISLLDGQMVKQGKKVSVVPTLDIKGDVDLSTGNINFNGSVNIRGSVQEGFSVSATGDVEIAGSISGGSVEGNDIIVKSGIQGMHNGKIVARNDLKASFVENAEIIAGHDVEISEAILHSQVNAGHKVTVNGRRGLVVGGAVTAGVEIEIKMAGNQMNTAMKLEVGVNPLLRIKMNKIIDDLKQTQAKLDETLKSLTILRGIPLMELSPNKQEMLVRLTKAQFPLSGEIKKMQDELKVINEQMEELKTGRIRIEDTVYPGVRIIIGSAVRNINSITHHSVFYEENGEIKIGAY